MSIVEVPLYFDAMPRERAPVGKKGNYTKCKKKNVLTIGLVVDFSKVLGKFVVNCDMKSMDISHYYYFPFLFLRFVILFSSKHPPLVFSDRCSTYCLYSQLINWFLNG